MSILKAIIMTLWVLTPVSAVPALGQVQADDWRFFCKIQSLDVSPTDTHFQKKCASAFDDMSQSVMHLSHKASQALRMSSQVRPDGSFYATEDFLKAESEYRLTSKRVLSFAMNRILGHVNSREEYLKLKAAVSQQERVLLSVHPMKPYFVEPQEIAAWRASGHFGILLMSSEYFAGVKHANPYDIVLYSDKGEHDLRMNPLEIVLSGGSCECCLFNAMKRYRDIITAIGQPVRLQRITFLYDKVYGDPNSLNSLLSLLGRASGQPVSLSGPLRLTSRGIEFNGQVDFGTQTLEIQFLIVSNLSRKQLVERLGIETFIGSW